MCAFLNYSLEKVAEMKSPVRHLIPRIHESLSALSSETKELLVATGVKLALNYVESTKFTFEVDAKTGVITLSTRALEVFWITSYLNAVYYQTVQDKGGLTASVEIDPQEEPDLFRAMLLFAWIINASFDRATPQEWPEELPKPSVSASKGSWEDLADELTLAGIGFILLHEFAHVLLKHQPTQPGDWSIDQEKEADQEAIRLYFKDLPDPASNQRVRRGLGVASVLLARVASAMFTGNYGGKSHPVSWQRLDQVVRQIEQDNDHPVFLFLAQLLPLYRSMSGKTPSQMRFEDFLQGFDKFIDEISQDAAAHEEAEKAASKASRT
jgi:hypothetical protein